MFWNSYYPWPKSIVRDPPKDWNNDGKGYTLRSLLMAKKPLLSCVSTEAYLTDMETEFRHKNGWKKLKTLGRETFRSLEMARKMS